MRPINLLVIHCTATPNGVPVAVGTIRQWHLARGFRDVGYHWVISLDGELHQTRPESEMGAHVKGFNSHSLGVCMVGGTGGPERLNPGQYSLQQWATLHHLVLDLQARYPGLKVCGHRDLSPDADGDGTIEPTEWVKLCPSFEVREWLASGMLPPSAHVLAGA